MSRFDYFVILAAMRTGSNFLQETLNDVPGLKVWGEAFNPHFIGKAGRQEMAGVTLAGRNRVPGALLSAMRAQTDGLAGFRFFHDHDPRMLDIALGDPRCGKIVLGRNPLDSFVSLEIARETGQWRLGDMAQAKAARIRFDAARFAAHLDELQAFRRHVSRRLQVTGQTAFQLDYDDLCDAEVLTGLVRFLGIAGTVAKVSGRTKVQNPAPLDERVENYSDMVAALGDIDRFDLARLPDFEPARGPGVAGFVAGARAPLIFLPMHAGPRTRPRRWLAALDGVDEDQLKGQMTQKDLRHWKRRHPGHRSFTVLRHPVARLHHAFCRRILMPGPDRMEALRRTLATQYDLPLPEDPFAPDYDAASHREALLAFARFVKGNLSGQTGVKVDPAWASQSALLQGMATVVSPDLVLREDEIDAALPDLARRMGLGDTPVPSVDPVPSPYSLTAIYDDAVEAEVRGIYQRDYMMFGFGRWA